MVSANNNKNKCQFCQPDHLLASNSLVEAQVDVPCKQICFLAKIVCKTNMSKKRLVLFGLVFFHCCFIQIDTVLKISFPFCIAYVHKLLPQKKKWQTNIQAKHEVRSNTWLACVALCWCTNPFDILFVKSKRLGMWMRFLFHHRWTKFLQVTPKVGHQCSVTWRTRRRKQMHKKQCQLDQIVQQQSRTVFGSTKANRASFASPHMCIALSGNLVSHWLDVPWHNSCMKCPA